MRVFKSYVRSDALSLYHLPPNLYKGGDRLVLSREDMEGDQDISGPLGLWPFPLLTALSQAGSNNQSSQSQSGGKQVETAKVIRDSNGEIQEVVVIKE